MPAGLGDFDGDRAEDFSEGDLEGDFLELAAKKHVLEVTCLVNVARPLYLF
jgi:hypothetical protein